MPGDRTFNFIRSGMNETYQLMLPEATPSNVNLIGNIMIDSTYSAAANNFIDTLINRIGLTMVHNKVFNNPLALLRKGSVPLGTDVQDIYTNPAIGEQYEYSDSAMARLLHIYDPDTHVAYYRRNKQRKYAKSWSREGLKEAFTSWEKFELFVASIANALYSGCYIDEFKFTKECIDDAYAANKAVIQTVTDVTDEVSAKDFIKKCRTLYTLMTLPSTDFNAFSKFNTDNKQVTTWTTPERIVLFIPAATLATIDVDVLAAAFNMDKAQFMGRVIPIDNFENDEIKGVICDEAFLQIYNNEFRMDEFYNASTMSWTAFLHDWNTYAISPFANAVILATVEPKPVTSIIFGSLTAPTVGEQPAECTLTLDPSDATSEIEFSVSDPTVISVEKVNNKKVKVTALHSGTARVIATADNGVTAEKEVTIA